MTKVVRDPITVHLVPGNVANNWNPGLRVVVWSLCGRQVQSGDGRRRLESWLAPVEWNLVLANYYRRCTHCMEHPDYPIELLGGVG